ncbi:MAG: class I SAM-dependent methyltransferase [Deltaproteobacteria bacterium]|nr:class I SAM-dependent methyltransferase [Deltaproteobacteria bacterium]
MRQKISRFLYEAYFYLCGKELGANLLNFQFLPSYYFRRDVKADGSRLEGRLLDVGCGNKPYRPYLKQVRDYIGLDYPVTKNIQDFEARPEVFGDARCLPFAAAVFDSVLCAQMLEHVDRPDQVLREIARILKPGGWGILSAPFIYNVHVGPHDFFRFSPFGIKALLAQAGLSLKSLRYQGGIGTAIVQLLHNWIFSAMAGLARKGGAAAGIAWLATALMLPLCVFTNLLALGLDKLAVDTERFSPNLWVLFAKE